MATTQVIDERRAGSSFRADDHLARLTELHPDTVKAVLIYRQQPSGTPLNAAWVRAALRCGIDRARRVLNELRAAGYAVLSTLRDQLTGRLVGRRNVWLEDGEDHSDNAPVSASDTSTVKADRPATRRRVVRRPNGTLRRIAEPVADVNVPMSQMTSDPELSTTDALAANPADAAAGNPTGGSPDNASLTNAAAADSADVSPANAAAPANPSATVASPANTATEGGQPATRDALDRQAMAVLTQLAAVDPRLTFSRRRLTGLVPHVAAHLAAGTTADELTDLLTHNLPAPGQRVTTGLLHYRLTRTSTDDSDGTGPVRTGTFTAARNLFKAFPAQRNAPGIPDAEATPRPLVECADCGRCSRALNPGDLCADCINGSVPGPPSGELRAQRLAALLDNRTY